MYTERPDSLGKIAEKIVGKSQSLELDPKTIKYVVNYDKKGKFLNIEFTDGEFVGVSVLGDNQQPAFTNSSFFSMNANFEEKMQMLKEYCTSKQERGLNMELFIENFVERSWSETSKMVFKALGAKYGEYNVYPVDWYDSFVVSYIYKEESSSSELYKVPFTVSDTFEVAIGDEMQVRVEYVEMPSAAAESFTGAEDGVEDAREVVKDESTLGEENAVNGVVEDADGKDENFIGVEEVTDTTAAIDDVEDGKVEDVVEEGVEDNAGEKAAQEDFDDKGEDEVTEPKTEENGNAPIVEEGHVDEGQQETASEKTEPNAGSTAFVDSERQELEELRREKKLNLINSYADDLNLSILKDFEKQIDNYTFEELESKLAISYRKESKSKANKGLFRFVDAKQTKSTDDIASLVNKYKKN